MRQDQDITAYIAGPMTGYPLFNFPAFDEAESRLRRLGFGVISPAAMDREVGFDPVSSPFAYQDLVDCVKRDVDAICRSDMIILLDGWEKSVGATAEVAVSKWLRKPIKLYKEYADI